jgi:hypothetical protein
VIEEMTIKDEDYVIGIVNTVVTNIKNEIHVLLNIVGEENELSHDLTQNDFHKVSVGLL